MQQVHDIWLTLQMTGRVILGVIFLGFILGMGLKSLLDIESADVVIGSIIFMNFIAAKFTYNVWRSYSEGIIADFKNNTFSFPASDVENSIQEILTLRPLFNLAKRDSFPITEITALTNETRRWTTKTKNSKGRIESKQHVKWLLNISGDFGSRQFEFSSKQKRDECRAMLNSASKKIGKTFASSDINLDL